MAFPVPAARQWAHEQILPPPLIASLVHRTTWLLGCPCGREVAANVVALLERFEIYDTGPVIEAIGRAHCRECRRRLKLLGGVQVADWQRRGLLPRLIVANGGDWWLLADFSTTPNRTPACGHKGSSGCGPSCRPARHKDCRCRRGWSCDPPCNGRAGCYLG